MIVLDTHIWVWWVHDDAQLPADCKNYVQNEEANGLGISTISLWEVVKLVEGGRLILPVPVRGQGQRRGLKGNSMNQVEANDSAAVKLRPRATTLVELSVPTDVLAELEHVAKYRDMSVEALLKLYIGQGLRQDTAKLFSERVLDLTAEVLTRHGQSQEQVEAILRELRSAASV